MKEETLTKMLDAGFTKTEILDILHMARDKPEEQTPETDPVQNLEQEADTDPEPMQEQTPEPEQTPEHVPDVEKRLTGIEQAMNNILKSIQAANLRNDSINIPPADSLEKQTDEIMASIIRPVKERNDK